MSYLIVPQLCDCDTFGL